MFEKRLQKALKQDLKTCEDVVNYCKKEMEKNYSERKLTEMQCICDYLCYRIEHNIDVNYAEYTEIIFKKIWG